MKGDFRTGISLVSPYFAYTAVFLTKPMSCWALMEALFGKMKATIIWSDPALSSSAFAYTLSGIRQQQGLPLHPSVFGGRVRAAGMPPKRRLQPRLAAPREPIYSSRCQINKREM